MDEYKKTVIKLILKDIKKNSILDVSKLRSEMFLHMDEFRSFVYYILQKNDPHFYALSYEQPKKTSNMIKTLNGFLYCYINADRNNLSATYSYLKSLNTKMDKYIISMYGVFDVLVCIIILSPFMKDMDIKNYGYRIIKKKDKIHVLSLFTNYNVKYKIPHVNIKYKKLVVLTNPIIGGIVSAVLPDIEIYIPTTDKVLDMRMPVDYGNDRYNMNLKVTKIPDNIIFSIPPKKYWPVIN